MALMINFHNTLYYILKLLAVFLINNLQNHFSLKWMRRYFLLPLLQLFKKCFANTKYFSFCAIKSKGITHSEYNLYPSRDTIYYCIVKTEHQWSISLAILWYVIEGLFCTIDLIIAGILFYFFKVWSGNTIPLTLLFQS